jgi:hypothetical protein
MAYYPANRNSPLFSDLGGLMLKTAGLAEYWLMRSNHCSLRCRPPSFTDPIARGEEGPESDIDLLVIGGFSPAEFALPLRRAGELLAREINPTVCTAAEFAKKRANKDQF